MASVESKVKEFFGHTRILYMPDRFDPGWRVEPDGRGGWRRIGRPKMYRRVAGRFREISFAEFQRFRMCRPRAAMPRRPVRARSHRVRRSAAAKRAACRRDDGSGAGDGGGTSKDSPASRAFGGRP